MVKESSEEYRILKSALESKTDPIEAATAFTKPTRDAFVTGRSEQPQLESYFWKAWASVTHLATETPHEEQEPLVEIVRAIQKQNVTDSEVTTEIEIWNAKMKLWQDMPLFGAQAREKWNRMPGTGNSKAFSPSQWQNINAFFARLTSISSSIPAFDFSLYAIWTLRAAFEEKEFTQANIDAGKMWLLYAGEMIEKLSREEKVFDGRMAREGPKYEGKNWRGFNVERLEIWKRSAA